MTAEEWRPIVGYPGLDGYEVSTFGRVRSWRRGAQGRVLATHPDTHGYPHLVLITDGRHQNFNVHRLVGSTFFGPLPEGLMTRHLDGNKSNNRVDNLRYGTNSENQRDSILHGTHHPSSATTCPQGHPYDEANTYLSPRGKRNCRTCGREANRRRRQRERAA